MTNKKATEKAKAEVLGKINKVSRNEPLSDLEVEVGDSVLVVGAGIAGTQSALDLAEEGMDVYVVEKNPYLGGRMTQLARTFPTLDCADCILSPKISDLTTHENITVYTYSELEDVKGYVTNFTVDIVEKPRYVEEDTCTFCGECEEICPVEVDNEFDYGLGNRGAVHKTHEEAVPKSYLVDIENCLQPPNPPCKQTCPVDAIDFTQQEKHHQINVDSIVVATGFDLYDLENLKEYNYGKSDDIIHAGHVERMIMGTGPTGGKIIRPSDGREPKSIAWILCAGSRDIEHKEYCSQICCMYSMKQANLLRNNLGPEVKLSIFYTDIRAAGKGFEEFYNDVSDQDIEFIRGKPSEIYPQNGGEKIVVRATDTIIGEILTDTFDLVVLAPAVVPSEGTKKMSDMIKIPRSADGFLQESHPKFKPVDTQVKGVFIAGMAQGPKDIPRSVQQGGAAASRVSQMLSKDNITLDPIVAEVDSATCDGCAQLDGPQCISECPFDAISIGEDKKAEINSLLCKGCGLCLSSCPTGAIEIKNYRDEQIFSEVEGLLEKSKSPKMIAFLDSKCSYEALDKLANRRTLYTSNVLPVEIPDGVMVTPSWITKSFKEGADGVFVGGCEEGSDPFSPKCAAKTEENVLASKRILEESGLNPDRVQLKLAVTGGPQGVLTAIEDLNTFLEDNDSPEEELLEAL